MKPVLREVWARIRDRLRAEVGEGPFESWLQSLILVEQRGASVRLATPTLTMRDFIEANFKEPIAAEWRRAGAGVEAVEIIVKPNGYAAVESPPPAAPSPLVAEAPVLVERFTFAHFVAGATNQVALRAARQVAEADRVPFNPLYVYGASGLGKTHLLQAIGWRMRERRPERRVLYVNTVDFKSRFVTLVNDPSRAALMEFKERYRAADLLLVDDLQFLSKPGATQEEFLHTLNALIDGSRQVVIAADRAPAELLDLSPALRTRLGGGMLAEIKPADIALRLAILKERAAQLGLTVDPRALDLVAHRVQANVRELEGVLCTMALHRETDSSPIGLDLAEAVLKQLAGKEVDRRIGIEEIQRRVAEFYKIRVADLRSPRRSVGIVRPRQVAMYIAKQLTTRSLPEIGRMFSRDHTTVMHSVRVIEAKCKTDDKLRGEVELLCKSIDS